MRDRARKAKQLNEQTQRNETSNNLVYNDEQQKLYDIFDKEIDNEEGSLDIEEPAVLLEQSNNRISDNQQVEPQSIQQQPEETSDEPISYAEQIHSKTETISRKNIYGSCESLANTIISEEEDEKEVSEEEKITEEEEREQYKKMVDEFEKRAEKMDKEAKGAGNDLRREVRNMSKQEAEREYRNTVEQVLSHIDDAEELQPNMLEARPADSNELSEETKEEDKEQGPSTEQEERKEDEGNENAENFESCRMDSIKLEKNILGKKLSDNEAKEAKTLTKKLSAIDIIKSGADQVPRYYVAEKRYDAEGNERKMNDYISDSDSEVEFASIHESELDSSSESDKEINDEKGFFERSTFMESEKNLKSVIADVDEENVSHSDRVDNVHSALTCTAISDTLSEIQEKHTGIEENNYENIPANLISSNKPEDKNSDDIFEELTKKETFNETMTNTWEPKNLENKPARPRQLAVNSLSSKDENETPSTNQNLRSPILREQNSLSRPEVVFRDQGSDINNLMDLMNQSENLLVENQQRGNSFMDMLLEEIHEMEKDPEFRREMESVHKLIGSDLEKAVEQMTSTVRKATEKLHGENNKHNDDTQKSIDEDSSEKNSTGEIEHNKTLDSEIGKGMTISEICCIVNNDDNKYESCETSDTAIAQEQTTPIVEIIGETNVQNIKRLTYEDQEEDENTYLETIFGGRQEDQADRLAPRSLLLSDTIQKLVETSDSDSDSEAPKLCYLSQEKQEDVRFRPLIEEIPSKNEGNEFDNGEKATRSRFDRNGSSSSSFESTTQKEVESSNKEESLLKKLVIQLIPQDKMNINSLPDSMSNMEQNVTSITSAKDINIGISRAVKKQSTVPESTTTNEWEGTADPQETESEINQDPQNDDTANETGNIQEVLEYSAQCEIPGIATYKVPLEEQSGFVVKETQNYFQIMVKSNFNDQVSDEHYIDCVPEFTKPLIEQEEIRELLEKEEQDYGPQVSHEYKEYDGHTTYDCAPVDIQNDPKHLGSIDITDSMGREESETHTTNPNEFTSHQKSDGGLEEEALTKCDEKVCQSDVNDHETVTEETDAKATEKVNDEEKITMPDTHCTTFANSKDLKCHEIENEILPQKVGMTSQSANKPARKVQIHQTGESENNNQSIPNLKFKDMKDEFAEDDGRKPDNDVISQCAPSPLENFVPDADLPCYQDHGDTLKSETDETVGLPRNNSDEPNMNNQKFIEPTDSQIAVHNVKSALSDIGAGEGSRAIWSKENEYFTVERYDPSPSGGLQIAIREVHSENTSKK